MHVGNEGTPEDVHAHCYVHDAWTVCYTTHRLPPFLKTSGEESPRKSAAVSARRRVYSYSTNDRNPRETLELRFAVYLLRRPRLLRCRRHLMQPTYSVASVARALILCAVFSFVGVHGSNSYDSTTQVVPQGSWNDFMWSSSGVQAYHYFVNAAGRDGFRVGCTSPSLAPL